MKLATLVVTLSCVAYVVLAADRKTPDVETALIQKTIAAMQSHEADCLSGSVSGTWFENRESYSNHGPELPSTKDDPGGSFSAGSFTYTFSGRNSRLDVKHHKKQGDSYVEGSAEYGTSFYASPTSTATVSSYTRQKIMIQNSEGYFIYPQFVMQLSTHGRPQQSERFLDWSTNGLLTVVSTNNDILVLGHENIQYSFDMSRGWLLNQIKATDGGHYGPTNVAAETSYSLSSEQNGWFPTSMTNWSCLPRLDEKLEVKLYTNDYSVMTLTNVFLGYIDPESVVFIPSNHPNREVVFLGSGITRKTNEM